MVMEKYQLETRELLLIKSKFKDWSIPEGADLIATQVVSDRRSLPRFSPLYRIPVCDGKNPRTQGIICDIHLKGLKVNGITVEADETISLIVRPGRFGVYQPFGFAAQCRWSMINDYGECVAGFLKANISSESGNELKKLLNYLTLPSSFA